MNETVFTNAKLITPDAVVEGTLVVRDGRIVSLDNGASSLAERIDLEGDYLMPGLVELHTDNLEKHFIPRPKVLWPQGVPAFFAHVRDHDRLRCPFRGRVPRQRPYRHARQGRGRAEQLPLHRETPV